jgi:group I intron endonuclease
MKISGIYKIINKINGKYYVGYSTHIRSRWQHHKYHLRKNLHYNTHLQRAWNNHGEVNFDFVLIEKVPSELVIKKEQTYLDLAKAEKDKCYNECFDSEGKMALSEDHKKRISLALKGKTRTAEQRKNMGDARRGEKHYAFGKHLSQTHKDKISQAEKGRVFSPDHLQKLKGSSHGGGWHLSDETKKKMSASRKGIATWNKDFTMFNFLNQATAETFTGIKSDFIKRYKLRKKSVYDLIKGIQQSYKGWIVIR